LGSQKTRSRVNWGQFGRSRRTDRFEYAKKYHIDDIAARGPWAGPMGPHCPSCACSLCAGGPPPGAYPAGAERRRLAWLLRWPQPQPPSLLAADLPHHPRACLALSERGACLIVNAPIVLRRFVAASGTGGGASRPSRLQTFVSPDAPGPPPFPLSCT